MDGSRLLVDTNIVRYALKGDMALALMLDDQELYIVPPAHADLRTVRLLFALQ